MPKRSDLLLITDMVKAIEEINDFIDGYNFDNFWNDAKTKAAVVRNLEIIGEASNMISDVIQTQFSLVDWRDMKRLRNKLIHEYFGIDYEIVWDVVKNELPKNLQLLRQAMLTFLNP